MRILGITVPDNKQALYGLTSVYGIGLPRAKSILDQAGISPTTKVSDLDQQAESAIRKIVDTFLLEGDLRRDYGQNIKHLKDVECYRGMRHSRSLPARGQRTKTNSRTVRGNKRVTMGSGRRKVEKT